MSGDLAVTGVPLKWTNDTAGYQCPYCGLFVCIPRATWAICPRCPSIPVDETAALVLSEAGIDDEDLSAAVEALMPILRALPTPSEAAR